MRRHFHGAVIICHGATLAEEPLQHPAEDNPEAAVGAVHGGERGAHRHDSRVELVQRLFRTGGVVLTRLQKDQTVNELQVIANPVVELVVQFLFVEDSPQEMVHEKAGG